MQRQALAWRAGGRVGLVPTMGALHEGHLALIRRAKRECKRVVVSIYVNPTQFGPKEDLARYPRPRRADLAACRAVGVDLVFAPANLYAPDHSTFLEESAISQGRDGASRPGHFCGVATVVLKLFNLVQPHRAYFGQKDAQQALVIRRLVRDLNVPTTVEVCPTVRERDGLARSSRNVYLSEAERSRALGLSRALRSAASAIADGERDSASVAAAARRELERHAIEPEYLALVDPETLAPVEHLDAPVLIAVAARVGRARLIDNLLANPGGR